MWNALYTVRGRNAIFGAFNLWCALNHVTVKINRIGKPSIHALQWRFESTCKSLMCPAGFSTSGKPCSARRKSQCHILCLSAVPKLQRHASEKAPCTCGAWVTFCAWPAAAPAGDLVQ